MHTLEQLRAGELAGVQRLQIKAGLTEFPSEIYDLADSLEILDLSGNALSCLPDDLPRLHKLRVLFCSDNQFTALPPVLGRCEQLTMVGFKANRIVHVPASALPPKLRWLILTDNAVETLPPEIGRCTDMQKLMLAGNRLTALPDELAHCHKLELLRIAANRLTALPDWLADLPRLSWLAFAGNPFSTPLELQALERSPVPLVAWTSLTLGRKLGEGASGVIYQATQQRAGDVAAHVAIKLFKGAVTSDGLPQSEMAACIAAGKHPDLIPVLGRIHGHPDHAQGLVMPLIDPDYGNLAGPPSLQSCTRDIYDDTKRFDAGTALRIAYGIASAAAHLHRQGILHGDLYGHNTLHCPRGRSLLGDFGAASFFDPAGPLAIGLQRIETRAFGCLLEELLQRCDGLRPELAARLHAWAAACLDSTPQARPPLIYIARQLEQILDNPF
ncbi:leucine-rich repeat-containing protein kinase family protein [Pseudoduganella ginsengisoli]|uniref:Protein kinase n=1 Tax=Pseudoduganella ginsengisoli TaxID=1462440 RepID=A0A6L6Q6F2_9BURK|nr:leucine-rich repeat-containing protein kinase family protein [Pseudoduganella ginsengisoli]MTW05357.1 protein kinase [Pseudoduganella ginsengisoli]